MWYFSGYATCLAAQTTFLTWDSWNFLIRALLLDGLDGLNASRCNYNDTFSTSEFMTSKLTTERSRCRRSLIHRWSSDYQIFRSSFAFTHEFIKNHALSCISRKRNISNNNKKQTPRMIGIFGLFFSPTLAPIFSRFFSLRHVFLMIMSKRKRIRKGWSVQRERLHSEGNDLMLSGVSQPYTGI